ncbi:MAG: hypothetical protein LBS10_03520 [Gracilibacteraceae bacterium]|jgi:hypothetical protein|nr:hypothetical protein [Gracilibacteraceae bacterium]
MATLSARNASIIFASRPEAARHTPIHARDISKFIYHYEGGAFAPPSTIPFIARYRKEATGGVDDATLSKKNEPPARPGPAPPDWNRNSRISKEQDSRLFRVQGPKRTENDGAQNDCKRS